MIWVTCPWFAEPERFARFVSAQNKSGELAPKRAIDNSTSLFTE
jgi:hypothetical protein